MGKVGWEREKGKEISAAPTTAGLSNSGPVFLSPQALTLK